jgi:hypothetical protein
MIKLLLCVVFQFYYLFEIVKSELPYNPFKLLENIQSILLKKEK